MCTIDRYGKRVFRAFLPALLLTSLCAGAGRSPLSLDGRSHVRVVLDQEDADKEITDATPVTLLWLGQYDPLNAGGYLWVDLYLEFRSQGTTWRQRITTEPRRIEWTRSSAANDSIHFDMDTEAAIVSFPSAIEVGPNHLEVRSSGPLIVRP
jgi:hypothetical protein